MSELVEKLRNSFQDADYRHEYAEECLNTMIATQIKVLREQRKMTQGELAEHTGMRQPRIPLLEDSNYSNWTINTLKRFAKAFDVALSVKFETFSKVILDFEGLSKATLQRPSFANDPLFQTRRALAFHRLRRRRGLHQQQFALQPSLFPAQVIEWPRPQIEWSKPQNDESQKALKRALQGEERALSVGSAS